MNIRPLRAICERAKLFRLPRDAMIRYALHCAEGHDFESWFASASAFDTLKAAGHISCAVCGSSDVAKSLMAPSVAPSATVPPAAAPQQGRPLQAPASTAEEALAALRREIESKSEYVGGNFATEARRIHTGDAPTRSIYGEARVEDARQLVEEGVNITPLPFIPVRKTN